MDVRFVFYDVRKKHQESLVLGQATTISGACQMVMDEGMDDENDLRDIVPNGKYFFGGLEMRV